jgi:dynein assembly factor 1, axonemal
LHQNHIEKIENLEGLVNLVTLNLSYNRIKRVEGLSSLPSLRNIDLSHNIIGANTDPNNQLDCISELHQCVHLTAIDLSHNIIECDKGLVEFFEDMQNILCLYLKGNPCVRKTSMYRKRMTVTLKQLQYLDDRPVFEIERIAANAWSEGGAEGEKVAREEYQEKKNAQIKSYTTRGRELTEEYSTRRK